jgi:hypothetical protein
VIATLGGRSLWRMARSRDGGAFDGNAPAVR